MVGVLTTPDQSPKRACPAIVLSHGYCSFKDEFGVFVELSSRMASAGYVVFRFDHRGCGESGGVRGRMLCSTEWPEDIRSAASYLQAREEVHPGKIGVLGVSMGGGAVILAAAADQQIRCVISLSPVGDGSLFLKKLWSDSFGEDGWKSFSKRVENDRKARACSGVSKHVPVTEILPFKPEDLQAYEDICRRYPLFITEAPLESADSVLHFKPIHCVHLIEPRPIRFIHGDGDTLVSVSQSLALYESAGQPKNIQVVEGGSHTLLADEGSREKVSNLVMEWFQRYLR